MRKLIGSDSSRNRRRLGFLMSRFRRDNREPKLRVRELTGSSEFATWVALAGAAIVAGLCAIYSSSPWVLIAAALIGAYLGYKGEQLCRAYVETRLSRNRPR
jgi:hypothetical protein